MSTSVSKVHLHVSQTMSIFKSNITYSSWNPLKHRKYDTKLLNITFRANHYISFVQKSQSNYHTDILFLMNYLNYHIIAVSKFIVINGREIKSEGSHIMSKIIATSIFIFISDGWSLVFQFWTRHTRRSFLDSNRA